MWSLLESYENHFLKVECKKRVSLNDPCFHVILEGSTNKQRKRKRNSYQNNERGKPVDNSQGLVCAFPGSGQLIQTAGIRLESKVDSTDQKEIHCQEWHWAPCMRVLKGSGYCLGLPGIGFKRWRGLVMKRYSLGGSLLWWSNEDVINLFFCCTWAVFEASKLTRKYAQLYMSVLGC